MQTQHETVEENTVIANKPTNGNGKARAETILGFPITRDRWTRTVTITPQKATMLLATMPPQRPINKRKVLEFKALIENGQFVLTHQGIACNTRGEPTDGQHRLHACVLADCPIEVDVTFNEQDNNFSRYDRGWSRQIAHDVEVQGIMSGRQASVLQAAGRLLYQYDAGRAPGSQEGLYNADALTEVIRCHPVLLETVEFVCGKQSRPPKPPQAPLVALGTLFREVDDTLALSFIDELITGEGLREGDPALVLRTSLGASVTRKNKSSRNAFMVRLVHAWNNIRAGKSVRSLSSFAKNGEFPAISGYSQKKETL